MNIFKGLLFLEGQRNEARAPQSGFAPSYGNQRASERAFRDLFAAPGFARSGRGPQASAAGACG